MLVLVRVAVVDLLRVLALECAWLENGSSQAAFKVLENMGSVTNFSVANSVKRGVVVLFGAAAMGVPLGLWPAVGAAVAVLGTALYWVSKVPDGPAR